MSTDLPAFRIDTDELLQHVSRVIYRKKAPYFGRDATNRYDAPAQDYGVLYLGLDLATALMESVFHKHRWDRDPKRSITLQEVQSRLVRVVGLRRPLHLADLTAPGVMAGFFGLNLQQLSSRTYTHTQKVSAQVHAMLGSGDVPLFDGLVYPSRNNYPARSIALFDRAETAIAVIDDIDLVDHADWPRFVDAYRVGINVKPERARRAPIGTRRPGSRSKTIAARG